MNRLKTETILVPHSTPWASPELPTDNYIWSMDMRKADRVSSKSLSQYSFTKRKIVLIWTWNIQKSAATACCSISLRLSLLKDVLLFHARWPFCQKAWCIQDLQDEHKLLLIRSDNHKQLQNSFPAERGTRTIGRLWESNAT